MKFVKELPKRQGYYWYVDLDWAIPQIGFLGPMRKFYNNRMAEMPESYHHHLRFGDYIEIPETEIEYD